MKKTMALVLLFLLIFCVSFKPASFAGLAICGPEVGEYLFKKHCSGCHHDPSKLRRVADLASSMRNPPAAMPQFGNDKISDINVQEIADYIHFASVVQSVPKKNDILNSSATVAERGIQ